MIQKTPALWRISVSAGAVLRTVNEVLQQRHAKILGSLLFCLCRLPRGFVAIIIPFCNYSSRFIASDKPAAQSYLSLDLYLRKYDASAVHSSPALQEINYNIHNAGWRRKRADF
jgi:hypothetical protein